MSDTWWGSRVNSGGNPGLMACVSLRLSVSGLLRTIPPFSRPLLLSVATEILVKKGKEDDETIHSFITRRLGKEVCGRGLRTFCQSSDYVKSSKSFAL